MVLYTILLGLLFASCNPTTNKTTTIETDENGVAILMDQEIEEIVKRSYQYVALYNVNQKLALAEEGEVMVQIAEHIHQQLKEFKDAWVIFDTSV